MNLVLDYGSMKERYEISRYPTIGEGRKRAYNQLMRETSNVFLGRAVDYLDVSATTLSFGEIVNEISKRKLVDGFETRAYFLRACYEVAGETDWEHRLKNTGASIEILLASMYHNNRIVDRKHNTDSPQAMGQEAIAEGFNAFAALSLLNQSTSLTLEEKNYITVVLTNAGMACMEGQFLDSSCLTYKQNEELPSFEQIEKRNHLVNAVFYEAIADVACRLSELYGKKRTALITFGRYFGIAQQIVNDIADFIPELGGLPTDEKLPSDAYADFRNGRITMPIWLALDRLQGEERMWFIERLEKGDLSTADSDRLTRLLWNSGIIREAQKIAQRYADKAKEAISSYPESERLPFSELLVVTRTNRYYRALRDFARTNSVSLGV